MLCGLLNCGVTNDLDILVTICWSTICVFAVFTYPSLFWLGFPWDLVSRLTRPVNSTDGVNAGRGHVTVMDRSISADCRSVIREGQSDRGETLSTCSRSWWTVLRYIVFFVNKYLITLQHNTVNSLSFTSGDFEPDTRVYMKVGTKKLECVG